MKSSIEFITASAGSGKTYRLVETVSQAIESGQCRPNAVIATTFTVAAANELRERLATNLYKTGRHDDAILLEAGMIGTVHSLCLDILTRFSLEAGLSPDLTILDDSQSQVLLSRAFDLVLSSDVHLQLYELADRLGQRDDRTSDYLWRKDIPSIVENARSNGIAPEDLPTIADASWKEMQAALPVPTDDDLDKELINAVQTALAALDPTPTANNARKCIHTLKSSLQALENGTSNWKHWESLRASKPAAAQKEALLPVMEIAARWIEHPKLHKDIKSYLRLLFEVAQRLYDTFGQLKREIGAADFTDLEKETLDLLKSSEVVRNILSENTDLLVVDEFQDTSPIQLALFSKLAECANRVVWVGDIKQAIYGFRNADPELITAAVSHAEKSETLDRSWRSAPDLVQFTNELFAPAFANLLKLPPNEVKLTPQRTCHRDAGPALHISEITTNEFTKGSKTKPPKLKALTAAIRPAASADAIKAFLDSGAEVVDKNSVSPDNPEGNLRPVTPKDIAVLVRKNDHAVAIATELRLRCIDVSLSCSGLLKTPESRLAIACLRVLTDPKDNLAVAEIIAFENEHQPEAWITNRIRYLRQSSEETPGGITGNSTEISPDQKRPAWGASGEINSPTVAALIQTRSEQNITSYGPLALFDLCHQIADLPTIISRWGHTQERVEQRLTNLSGLREFIEQYQESSSGSGDPSSLPGLFSWLEDLAEDRKTEALDKCPIDPEIDAIHIGTYHGSKGLEWPVVFAANLDAETRTRLFSLRPHSDNDQLDLANPLANRSLRLWVLPLPRSKTLVKETLEASEIGQAAMNSAISEELRLLYVGLTRARDTMVILHDPAKQADWLDIAAPSGILLQDSETEIQVGECTVPIQTSSFIYEEYAAPPSIASDVQVPTSSDTHTPRLPLRITPSAQQPNCKATINNTIEFGQRLSCHGKVIDRDYGDAMHRLLAAEILNSTHPDRITRATRLLSHWNLGLNFAADQALATCDRYRQWIEDTFAPISQQVEVPFTHSTEEGQQVSGFIDHLLHTEHGPVIIDHKSFQGRKSDWHDKALSYSGQLALYGQIIQSSSTNQQRPQTWIHFISSGSALEVSV